VRLTGRSGKENYLEAMAAGADDFIAKPLEKEGLAARLRVAERILGMHESLCVANSDLERCVRERTAELETALHANEKFLAQASHELLTPMHHVLGFARVLERGALTAAQAVSVRGILTSGGHLLTLIDHILAVAQASPADRSSSERTAQPKANGGEMGSPLRPPGAPGGNTNPQRLRGRLKSRDGSRCLDFWLGQGATKAHTLRLARPPTTTMPLLLLGGL
jgi:CheY-like chemotaxis protein